MDRAVELIEPIKPRLVSGYTLPARLVDAARHQARTYRAGLPVAEPQSPLRSSMKPVRCLEAAELCFTAHRRPLVTVGSLAMERLNWRQTDGRVCNYSANCDDDGNEVGLNVDGEIWVRGPAMMQATATPIRMRPLSRTVFSRRATLANCASRSDCHHRPQRHYHRGGGISQREIEEAVMLHLQSPRLAVPAPMPDSERASLFLLRCMRDAPGLSDLTALCAELQLAKQKYLSGSGY